MNVTQLNIIATSSTANIQAGQVVAFRRANDDLWSDPWGGVFDDAEQTEFNNLAKGDNEEVVLSGVNGEDRVFTARLAVK
jgi:hypothetical protein